MKISMIAAVSDNGVIGVDNMLPWEIKEDLRKFKAFTKGNAIIMGRNTWISIGCKPLPGRRNVVLSSSLVGARGAEVFTSLNDALSALRESGEEGAVIIGGPRLYAEALPMVDVISLTRVHTYVKKGDAFFPLFDTNNFTLRKVEKFYDTYNCTYQEWVRKQVSDESIEKKQIDDHNP